VSDAEPRLYGELAPWFHLLTAPHDYAEEAEQYRRLLLESCAGPVRTVLELGSGGGNNASHLKAHFELTLVDRSPQMLELSRTLNPECRHELGDMRSVRLGETFDASSRTPARAATTARIAAFGTWNGSGIPTRPTRRTSPTSRISCATRTEGSDASRTGTSAASSRGRPGSS